MPDRPPHTDRLVTNEDFMRMAIDKAREGIHQGQTPFGACIVKGGQVVVCAHNAVWGNTDITAHAEVQALRAACRVLDTVDLSGCTVYSTVEPCPMCFSACHWARIDRIVYGSPIEVAKAQGFHELTVSNEQMKTLGNSPVEIISGVLAEETAALFREWEALGRSGTY